MHISTMLVFWSLVSLVRNSVVLAVYLLFSVACFFTAVSYTHLKNEKIIYALNIVLFAVWHIGYMIPQIAVGNWIAVSWKIIAGAGYGLVIGFVRLKIGRAHV